MTGPAGTTSIVWDGTRDSPARAAGRRGGPWVMAGGWLRCRVDDRAVKGIPICSHWAIHEAPLLMAAILEGFLARD